MKRMFALLLSVVMLISTGNYAYACELDEFESEVIVSEEQQYQAMSAAEITKRLDKLKLAFPDGMYWNHKVGESYSPDAVTNHPCEYEKYKCNSEVYGGMCIGFARYLATKVFGKSDEDVDYNSWLFPSTSLGWTVAWKEDQVQYLEPGDILCFSGEDFHHDAIVWKVDGDWFQVAEVWGASGCQISWGNFNGNSKYNTLTKLKAAGDLIVYKHPGAKGAIPTAYFGTPFIDINTHWARENIRTAYLNNWFSGTSKNKFSPDLPMTRAMAATVLYRMAGEPSVTSDDIIFSDVKSGAYYEKAVMWAYTNGISSGTGRNRFSPNAVITREEFVTMLYRYAMMTEYEFLYADLSEFTDEDEINSYATDAFSWAVANGIINGVGNNRLAPQGVTTRAQIATMLVNFQECKEE